MSEISAFTALEQRVRELEAENARLKNAEKKLRISEELFRLAFRTSPDSINLNRASDGMYVDINEGFTKIMGYTRDEIIGKSSLDLNIWEDPNDRKHLMDGLNAAGYVENMEARFVGKNGDRKIGLMSARILNANEETIILSITRDITDWKLAEADHKKLERQIQQTQKMESLGVLAGGIAHDFNNILMAVLGHAELAMDEISPMSAARGSLQQITTAARRAAELCRQMLAYSGRATFTLERVNLRELIEEMAHLLKTSISKKAVLNLSLERGLPAIQVDPSQIRQIVLNLIINASEAVGDRSGVITVAAGATRCDADYLKKTELHDSLAPGFYVHLEVTDTGCGMDAETRGRIFEPFFTTRFTGRGLGLAAVLGIVRAHRGAIKVYSEFGKGTTFKVLFPALDMEEKKIQSHAPSLSGEWRGKGMILLADDEESLRALGAMMLERLGFTVLTAADGRDALELYQKRQDEINLVVLDLTMPHMDGAQAFGELRRINPDIRVLLASGYSKEDVTARFAGKRLSGVLQKPYSLSKLRELLMAVSMT
jgi:two-component system, cell cycle sensor histidine kinase and response regulator CckA